MSRIFGNLLLLVSVFIFPEYLSLLLIIVSIFLFENFFESIFWAYCIDLLYSGGHLLNINFHFVFTFLVLVIFISSFKIKKQLKFYS